MRGRTYDRDVKNLKISRIFVFLAQWQTIQISGVNLQLLVL